MILMEVVGNKISEVTSTSYENRIEIKTFFCRRHAVDLSKSPNQRNNIYFKNVNTKVGKFLSYLIYFQGCYSPDGLF